ncbi:lysophosphatidic acid phosphatase type 6-like isoform X1 [Mytilus galloprovincialis]|uniref:lysophosphatidic acid phosphatase type 6-like isoform X1 n=2 Tax=Mytilus galloprovincialis TaxID=29158 RepID=UPI003F7C085C
MRALRYMKRFSLIGLSVCAGCSLKWMILDSRVLASVTEVNNDSSSETMRLKHVQILFRHGARTPLHLTPGIEQATYPANMLIRPAPHTMVNMEFFNKEGIELLPSLPSRYDLHYQKTKLKGGSTSGLLTTYGQDQMYLLGKRLRKEYIENIQFLDSFDPNLVKLKTTHMKRTKESLRCVLAGFFGAENLNKNGPVRVESNDTQDEYLVPCPNICPVFRQINHSAMIHGSDIAEFNEDRTLLEETLGKKHFSKKRVRFIDCRDDLIARKTHGLPFPERITPEIIDMVDKNATKLLFYAVCGQHEAERLVATRLSIGRLIQVFLDNIQDVVKGENKAKMQMYSAHDSTVLPAMSVFGLDVTQWPPFAADLILELYEDNDKNHYVQVKYLGKPQIVRGCDKELCPLDKFLEEISPFAISEDEFQEVCHSNILEVIAKEMLEQEVGEIEDEESKERSDLAPGL